MKYEDIATLSEAQLREKSKELRSQIFEARMKNALGQMANPMEIRHARRDVARLKTALNGKKSGQAQSSAKGSGK